MRYALSNLKSTYTDGGMGRFRLEYVLHTPNLHTYTTSLIMRIYVSAIHTTFSSEARAPTKLFKLNHSEVRLFRHGRSTSSTGIPDILRGISMRQTAA